MKDLYGSKSDTKQVVSNHDKDSGLRFPKIWPANGTIQRIPESNIQYVEGYRLTDKYPDHYITNHPIENFRIYLNEKDYFLSKLPILAITTDCTKADWDDDESYYRVCFSVNCASYCCGVSIQQLTPSASVHQIITSLMRFHLHFTVRRLLRRMEGGEKMNDISREFNAGKFYRNIELIRRNMTYRTREVVVCQLFPSSLQNDYKRYITLVSNEFTQIGIQYINQSIEIYLYSIVGCQPKTKQSIISIRGSALETQ